MTQGDYKVVAKALALVLAPRLKKASEALDDILLLVEDLQDRLDDAEERIVSLEGRV